MPIAVRHLMCCHVPCDLTRPSAYQWRDVFQIAVVRRPGSFIVDGRMGAIVPVRASAVCSNCGLYPSSHIDRPNPVPLRPRPSPNRRHLLPEPHQISSCDTMPRAIWCPPLIVATKETTRPTFSSPQSSSLVGCILFFRLNLFVATITASVVSFSAHVYLDKQYHTDGSILARFAWFRRKQQLHFVHHLHGDSNFAVIDFFWDRVLGTFRSPDTDAR